MRGRFSFACVDFIFRDGVGLVFEESSDSSNESSEESDASSASDREEYDERQAARHAAMAQMMKQNREGLGMRVIEVMVQAYGALPRELWDLNSISDMGAGRGITYDGFEDSTAMLERITSNNRYSIVDLTIGEGVSDKVELPSTLRQLIINAREYNFSLDLPPHLYKLAFRPYCTYNRPVAFPSTLVELELGWAYASPLILPSSLKRLVFARHSVFNFPLVLPASVTCVYLGDSYNQPTVLPREIEEVRVGESFAHDLSFPPTLRKIEWGCNRPIHIPDGVSEVVFSSGFNQPVILPPHVRKVSFHASTYPRPVTFPIGLQELTWYPEDHHDLVLPEALRKLTWASERPVELPSGLTELVIARDAPLSLPEGLLKVTFAGLVRLQRHYTLPESVQQVVMESLPTFTHPSTLRHLILNLEGSEVDLSRREIHKLTLGARCYISIEGWPQGIQELEFTVDYWDHPLRIPPGCNVVGGLPWNVTRE